MSRAPHIRSDNGREFVANAVHEWIAVVGASAAVQPKTNIPPRPLSEGLSAEQRYFYLIGATLRGIIGQERYQSSGWEPWCFAAWREAIMSRVIAVMACGFMLAACSTTMPSLDFMKSAPQAESLAIESEPPGAEAKTSLGQSCRTPCQLSVQPGSEFSVRLR